MINYAHATFFCESLSAVQENAGWFHVHVATVVTHVGFEVQVQSGVFIIKVAESGEHNQPPQPSDSSDTISVASQLLPVGDAV